MRSNHIKPVNVLTAAVAAAPTFATAEAAA